MSDDARVSAKKAFCIPEKFTPEAGEVGLLEAGRGKVVRCSCGGVGVGGDGVCVCECEFVCVRV